jgi:hypothetical protein
VLGTLLLLLKLPQLLFVCFRNHIEKVADQGEEEDYEEEDPNHPVNVAQDHPTARYANAGKKRVEWGCIELVCVDLIFLLVHKGLQGVRIDYGEHHDRYNESCQNPP